MKEDKRTKGYLKKRMLEEGVYYYELFKKNGSNEQGWGNAEFHLPQNHHLTYSKSVLLESLSFSMKQGGLNQDEESLVCISALTNSHHIDSMTYTLPYFVIFPQS